MCPAKTGASVPPGWLPVLVRWPMRSPSWETSQRPFSNGRLTIGCEMSNSGICKKACCVVVLVGLLAGG